MEALAMKIWWSLILLLTCRLLAKLCNTMWWKPNRIRWTLSRQGIGGPKPNSFLFGNAKEMQEIESMAMNMKIPPPPSTAESSSSAAASGVVVSHQDWLRFMFPYLQKWTRDYGRMYMFSTGRQQHLYVTQPELIKELKVNKSLDLGKPEYLSKAHEPMLGNGIIKANGQQWAYQRKIIAPEFFLHKVKGMIGLMEESTMAMIRTWENRLAEGQGGVADLIVDQDLRSLSADIISKACFGSSYAEGKNIFAKLQTMQEAMSKPSLLFGLPNYFSFLPTRRNREIWRLKKEVEDLILKVVKGRQEEGKNAKDLLQMILENAANDSQLHQRHIHKIDRFIVDNCKNIYFAGFETTAITASWTLMFLALHPQWQERVRAEATVIFGHHPSHRSLDLDALSMLKTLTMVIQESLRLYAPSLVMARQAFADLKLGDYVLPKGLNIWSLIPALHRDPENWGPDAHKFKPERFTNGISEACKYPQTYIPFGAGTRVCVGQTFAMLELKVVLSLLLSRFSFSISPKYIHSPVYRMLLTPEHGMRLIVKEV